MVGPDGAAAVTVECAGPFLLADSANSMSMLTDASRNATSTATPTAGDTRGWAYSDADPSVATIERTWEDGMHADSDAHAPAVVVAGAAGLLVCVALLAAAVLLRRWRSQLGRSRREVLEGPLGLAKSTPGLKGNCVVPVRA